MEHVRFDDKCEILRATDTLNEYDEPVFKTIYNGKCLYVEASSTIYGIITHSATLFVVTDGVSERINTNDIVRITTWEGRKIESLVKVPRDIKLHMGKQTKIVRLELKQVIAEE